MVSMTEVGTGLRRMAVVRVTADGVADNLAREVRHR